MRTGIAITVSPADRCRLLAVVNDRNAAQKHVWRCRIVMLTAEGGGTNEIMRQTNKSKSCVWRWQEPLCAGGVLTASCATRPGLRASSHWAMKPPHGWSP